MRRAAREYRGLGDPSTRDVRHKTGSPGVVEDALRAVSVAFRLGRVYTEELTTITMNCVLYVRVSTDKQAEKESSLPAQLEVGRQHTALLR